MLLVRIIKINLLMILLLVVGMPSQIYAAPGDETTLGIVSLTPTFECIGVISEFTGDNNQNNSAVLEYRQAGTSNWSTAPEMYAARVDGQYRGSIFWLTPNTDYEVRVTYSDSDGVAGNPVTATTKTRNDNPSSNGNTYYVATTGSDSNPGTEGLPFRTIQKAADTVSAGDIVLVRAGTYNETVDITTSGLENNYITFMPFGNDEVILDGEGTLSRLFNISNANYIRIKGFTIKSSYDSSAIYITGATGVIIEDNVIIDPDIAGTGTQGGIRLCYGATNSLIQRNSILLNAGPVGNRGTIMGIAYWEPGGGHVIRDNFIKGTVGSLRDGFGGGPEDLPQYMHDLDFYNNTIVGAQDEGIQPEGGNVNIRIWNNRIEDSYIGIGLCPTDLGPAYVFRNVIFNCSQAEFKLGDGSYGRLYFYHNTFYSPNGDITGYKQTNNGLGNIVSKNNIIHAGRYVFEMREDTPHDFDYDNLFTSDFEGGGRFLEWNGSRMPDLPTFQDRYGQELHGISVADSQFVNLVNGDFRLQSTSPCVEAGVILPGFNDENSPWPYQGSAPDIGAYEYNSGGVTNRPPVLYTIGNKSTSEGQLLEFTILATDPDGDPITYFASNLPSGATFNTTTHTFSWTPTTGQAGTYPNVHFEVSDGTLTDSENITITVTTSGGNQPPVLNSIGNKSVNEDQLLEFTISATDPDGNPLTYSASNLPSGASFDTDTRTFSWTPTTGQAGTYPNVHFEVSDGTLTDSEDITITVQDQAQPPTLPLRVNAAGNAYTDGLGNSWQADQAYATGSWGFHGNDNTIDRGTGYPINGTDDDRIYQTERYGLSGYRFDLGNGTYNVNLHFAETYSGITGPGQRVFDVSIEGQLVLDDLDIFSEVGHSTALKKTISGIVVQDGQLNIDFVSSIEAPEINGIEIFTAGTNQPPVLNSIGDKSVNEGQLLEFTISATDPDGNPLTYSASNLPSGTSFDTDTRTFSWTPTSGQAGTYPNVHFEVSDGTLTDSEDIAITVSTTSPFVGGGGGGGPGSRDTAPPRLTDIITSDITKNSASIYWTTQEMSDSQVEYWASPSTFSPLDETMVINHVVHLTDLTPATTYNYKVMSRDADGNLAVSAGHTVTTLGSSATFTVSALDITPAEVYAGEAVLVSVQVTNRGDAAGNYEVILRINDTVVATKDIVDLPAGATQEVTFNAARDTAGVFTIDVNSITGSFVVKEALATKIGLFSVNPSYESETGQFACARVAYEVDNLSSEPMADVRLILKVSLDNEPFEAVSLFSTSQLELVRTGSLDYLPPQGWESGTYTFQAELYINGELYASTIEENLEVNAESAVTVVSWAILGAIIGTMLIVIAATVVVILRRKRGMLGA